MACNAFAAFAAPAPNPHIAIGVNQMGWRPDSPKWCRVVNPPSLDYVLETIGTDVTWRIVHRGRWVESANSNGTFFADITEAAAKPGDYRVLSGGAPENRGGCTGGLPGNFSGVASFHFPVWDGAYDNLERMLVGYCTWQRCGHRKGWAGLCHQDPAPVKDKEGRTVRTIDVRGGYHQSADLRCWHDGISMSMYNLLRYAERGAPAWDVDGDIDGNLRWGCDYFLKVISPEGYLYDCQFVPIGWGPRDYYARPSPLGAHANVIMLFARASRHFAEKDPVYAETLLAAAKRLHETVETNPFFETAPRDFVRKLPPGTQPESWYADQHRTSVVGVSERCGAALELYRATRSHEYAEKARALGLELCRRIAPDREPFKGCSYCYSISGYAMPLELFCEFGDAAFKECAIRIADWIMGRIVAADYGPPAPKMGAGLLSRLPILARGAAVFGREDMRVAAQRAFDWMLGSNPMCSSYVDGAGQNQWQRPVFGQFFPSTPQIPGGLLHFWGGEYDMPVVTMALWTLAELYPGDGARKGVVGAGGKNASGRKIRVACVGDSITWGTAMTNRVAECYPAQLQKILGDRYEVVNFGNPGSCVYSDPKAGPSGWRPHPWRAGGSAKAAYAFKPDIVVGALGANDAAIHMYECIYDEKGAPKTEPGLFRREYIELLKAFEGDGRPPRYIVWTKLAPLGKKHRTKGKPDPFVLRGDLEAVALAVGAETLDMFTPLLPYAETEHYAADGVHPEGRAQRVIAEVTARKILEAPNFPSPPRR